MLTNFSQTSGYNGLLMMKKQLKDSISLQTDTLSILSDKMDSDTNSWPQNTTWTDVNSQKMYFIGPENVEAPPPHYIETKFRIKIYDSETGEELLNELYDRDLFQNNTVLGESGVTTDDLINSLCSSEKNNEMFYELNDLYLSRVKANISVIRGITDKYAEAIPTDARNLAANMATLTSVDNDVNQSTFIELLRANLAQGKSNGDNESFVMDDTNPYVITGFLNNVFNMVLQLVVSVFGLIVSIFSKLLGALVMVAGSLISVWLQAKETYGQIRVQDEYPLWHIAGAVRNTTLNAITGCTIFGVSLAIAPKDRMLRVIKPGCELFIWGNPSTSNGSYTFGSINQQCFITLNVHPDRFMEYVYYNLHVSTHSTNMVFDLKYDTFCDENDEVHEDDDVERTKNKIWLTDEDYTQLQCDGDFLRRTIAANIAAYCMCFLRPHVTMQILNANSGFTVSTDNGLYDAVSIGATSMGEINKFIINNGSFSSYKFFNDWTISQIASLHQALFGDTSRIGTSVDSTGTTNVTIDYTGGGTTNVFYAAGYSAPFHGYSTSTTQEGSGRLDTWIFSWNSNRDLENVLDDYPVSPKVVLPALDFDKLLGVLVAIGIAVTATLFIGKFFFNKLKARSLVKKGQASKRLQESYNQAVASGSKEDLNEFQKQYRKFNLKAKIFGWGSYDPTNGWWDNEAGASTPFVSSFISGEDKQTDNIAELKTLITG